MLGAKLNSTVHRLGGSNCLGIPPERRRLRTPGAAAEVWVVVVAAPWKNLQRRRKCSDGRIERG